MISVYLDDGKELKAIYAHMNQDMVTKWYVKGLPAFPVGEIRPGVLLPAVALGKSGNVNIVPMIWGMTFPPVPGKTTGSFVTEIRTDIPQEKKAQLWTFHRCLVPFSWYYESEYLLNQHTGHSDIGPGRYLCQPQGSDFSYLACVYHLENGLPAFAVCTCPSCLDMFPRMPVIFGKELVHQWIDPDVDPDSLFRSRLISLITDYEAKKQ